MSEIMTYLAWIGAIAASGLTVPLCVALHHIMRWVLVG
jgi:hypothetical protein